MHHTRFTAPTFGEQIRELFANLKAILFPAYPQARRAFVTGARA